MPIVFGQPADGVAGIVAALQRNGDSIRGGYRSIYRYSSRTAGGPYRVPLLERPPALQEEPTSRVYPWEQIFVAAAACAGSDYPALAEYWDLPLERVERTVEGVFDPRGEFEGLNGLAAPQDARHCFVSLYLRATLISTARRADLERLHRRVIGHNMALGALRGVPLSDDLMIGQPQEALGA